MRAVVTARVWFRAVTGTAPTYIVHGLRVRSEVPLPVPALEEDGEPDLTVRWAKPRGVPDERPDGELRSEIEMGERRCWIVDDPDGHLVRCNLRCEFRLSPDRREVDVHLPGGTLKVAWAEDGHVWLSGPAEEVFTGELS
jgi:hypothetical protein